MLARRSAGTCMPSEDCNKPIDCWRAQSHAFSPKALLGEDIVLKYADMLMVAIREESAKGPLYFNDCYNWVTFDGIPLNPTPCLSILIILSSR
jgi:hypothetical protein